MNWEKSKAITPLKLDFIKAFFEEDRSFYLTGGSALGIFYLDHRYSYDLDFFSSQKPNWHVLENRMASICKDIAARYDLISASPEFYRFRLIRNEEQEIVDFVVERIPQIEDRKNTFGKIRVDTLKEIFINKICMLVSRCELKDVIDLYFLEKKGFEIKTHMDEARQKEAGLDPSMISFLLSTLEVPQLPEYLIAPLQLSELQLFLNDLRKDMASLSFPDTREDKNEGKK